MWPVTVILLARALIEDERSVLRVSEVEHIRQHAGAAVEGSLDPCSVQPIVFDEAQDRALIGHRVVDEVLLRAW